MRTFRSVLTIILVTFAFSANAGDLFTDEVPSNLFSIGFRLGVNTSNRTFPAGAFNRWNVNGWGTGIDLGCVANLNIRNYIALQPGIFIGSRSGDYSYANTYFNDKKEEDDFVQLGHDRYYNVTVPVMASLRLNLSDNFDVIAEAGPYFQYILHDSAKDKVRVMAPQTAPDERVKVSKAQPSSFDAGLKIGGGISYRQRYSFHIHYLAGGVKAWKEPIKGGHNKSWTFTIGYEL